MSNAVSLPSVDMLIVNSKRMQAEIAKPAILSKFLEPAYVSELIDLSGEIYEFDSTSPEGMEVLLSKMKEENYVLKPNREGGGNNFFGQDAYKRVQEMSHNPETLSNYIVMKGIPSKI